MIDALKFNKFLLCLSAIFIWLNPLAMAIEFLATVDKNRGTTEDSFELTLTVSGARNAPQPEFGEMPDFQVQSQGSSSNIQVINGKMSASIAYSYVLIPKREGNLQVPSARIEIDGQVYHSHPIAILISKAAAVPEQERLAFAKAYLSNENAYVGQQLTYNFEVYLRQGLQIDNLHFNQPETKDFLLNELKNSQRMNKVLAGIPYEVIEIKLALFPLKPGSLEIPSGILSGHQIVNTGGGHGGNDPFGFFGSKARPFQLLADPVQIQVAPLPLPQPAEFKGLVGRYGLQAEFSQVQVNTGDSITLKIIISGTGKAEGIPKPSLNFDPSIKIYEDKPVYQNQLQGNQIIGQAQFTSALVPSLPGTFKSPKIAIVYFDTNEKKYLSSEKQLPEIIVQGESKVGDLADFNNNSKNGVKKQKVERLGEDLLPIHKDIAALTSPMPLNSTWNWMMIFGVLPVFFYGSIRIIVWKLAHSQKHRERIYRNQAYTRFQKELKRVQTSQLAEAQALEESTKALKNLIGDKLLKYGIAMTAHEIQELLRENAVEPDTLIQVQQLLEYNEMARYGAGSLSPEQVSNLLKQCPEIGKQIHQKIS